MMHESLNSRYIVLIARLLWTEQISKDLRWRDLDAGATSHAVSWLLPGQDSHDPHMNHQRWFAEYAYFGHSSLPESQQNPHLLSCLSRLIWDKDKPDPNQEFPKRAMIDHRYVLTAMEVVADQITRGAQPPHEWNHLSLLREFTTVESLAQGGEGIVAKVKRPHLFEHQAIKVPIPDVFRSSQSPHYILRLIFEARLLQRIRSNAANLPNCQVAEVTSVSAPVIDKETQFSDNQITTILRLHLTEAPIYVAYKFYPDGSLHNLFETLPEGQLLGSELVAAIALQLAVTLAGLHQMKIQHRDLKPRNLLRSQNRYYLSDFGMSVQADAAPILQGIRYGTRNYMAPEQFQRDAILKSSVDVWAFGVILYRMLTGKLPFDGASNNDIERNVREGQYEDLKTLNPNCDPELADIVAACLEKDPEKRCRANLIASRLSSWLEQKGHVGSRATLHAWNPEIIARLTQKRCVFILASVSRSNTAVQKDLVRILRSYDCTVFRIYRVLGDHDFLIRAYLSYESIELLQSDVLRETEKIRPIQRVLICPVKDIVAHWYWNEYQTGAKDWGNFDVDTAAALGPILGKHGWEYSPDCRKQIARGILRKVNEHEQNIIVFVFLQRFKSTGTLEQLLRQVQAILDRFLVHHNGKDGANPLSPSHTEFHVEEKKKNLRFLAVYELARDPYFLLIKAEVENYFVVGKLVAMLNDELSASDCMTMTCIVADQVVLGQEELNLAYSAVGPLTKILASEFPNLVSRWRRISESDLDEGQLRFASELLLRIQYRVQRRFYKETRTLLELILTLKISQRPIVHLFARILANASIAAQEAFHILTKNHSVMNTEKLLELLTKGLIEKVEDRELSQQLGSMKFGELTKLMEVSRIDAPDNPKADTPENIETFFGFLEKLYELDEVCEIVLKERPFRKNWTFQLRDSSDD